MPIQPQPPQATTKTRLPHQPTQQLLHKASITLSANSAHHTHTHTHTHTIPRKVRKRKRGDVPWRAHGSRAETSLRFVSFCLCYLAYPAFAAAGDVKDSFYSHAVRHICFKNTADASRRTLGSCRECRQKGCRFFSPRTSTEYRHKGRDGMGLRGSEQRFGGVSHVDPSQGA
jgi:hypothetical protein